MPCDCKNEGVPSIPFVAYESEMTRNERHIKRLIVALIVAVAAIFLSNAVWLYAWCQYDYIGASVESVIEINGTDGGNANYIGNDGDIYNGEDKDYKAQEDESADTRDANEEA
ncbi:MAG: hypothetical protein K2O14_10720 [Oscillospiraceae bacterium]|nr:hypothetical protein [Oscillospiraceae bacterium]